jgi:hypothetical protein
MHTRHMLVRSFLIPFRFCTTTSLLNQGLVRLLFWCAAVLTCSPDCTCHSCIFVWHKRHDVVQYVVLKKCCSNMFHYLTYNMLVQICWFRYVPRVLMPTVLLEFYPSICLLTMQLHFHPIMLSRNNYVNTNNYDE